MEKAKGLNKVCAVTVLCQAHFCCFSVLACALGRVKALAQFSFVLLYVFFVSAICVRCVYSLCVRLCVCV